MLRYGHITELDASKGLAKVKFDEDNIVSDWLQIVVRNSISNKSESWFDVDEFVCVMMDKHDEEGIILGAVYHEGNTPPIGNKDTVGVTFPDGTVVKYNRSDSKFTIECVGEVNVTCTKANFTGDVTIDGALTVSGTVDATGQVTALKGTPGQVRLTTHIHPTPSGPSSAPTPGT